MPVSVKYFMKLNAGNIAPDFELPMTGGGLFRLGDKLKEGKLILYFYPKDFTGGCTAEACGFRDEFGDLRRANLRVFGISTDTVESHERFREEHSLPFDLISDVGGKIAEKYGVYNKLFKIANRVTFIIDVDGRILSATKNMFSPKTHLRAAKAAAGG